MRPFARLALPVVSGLFVACCVIQVFLAGLGVFDDPAAFLTHAGFAYLFGWLTLIMLVLAIAGRSGRFITGLTGLILVQFALQSVFVALRASMPAVAALHPLNGFAILLVSIVLTRRAWAARQVQAPASRAAAPAVSAEAG